MESERKRENRQWKKRRHYKGKEGNATVPTHIHIKRIVAFLFQFSLFIFLLSPNFRKHIFMDGPPWWEESEDLGATYADRRAGMFGLTPWNKKARQLKSGSYGCTENVFISNEDG